MAVEHLIGQCRWQSRLDQQEGAVAVQDRLSHWSRDVLPAVLDEVLDACCPAQRTLRIDRLELQLGEIALQALEQELPRRLGLALSQALAEQRQRPDDAEADQQWLAPAEVLGERLGWFLRHGSLPWSARSSVALGDGFDEMLACAADALAQLLRDLGRSEPVRRRIVWQLGEARVRAIVQLLEPVHGEVVCQHAEQLFEVQARRQLLTTGERGFRDQVWQDILAWLLVDRGSLFNTTSFVRDLLWRTAQRHGLAAPVLLEQLYLAVQALRPLGIVQPTFFTAIVTLHQQQPDDAESVLQDRSSPWHTWQAMLQHGQGQARRDGRSLRYGDLFEALARQDAERMTALLYRFGIAASVREGLLRHLQAPGLAVLTQLLAPRDHLFILAHVAHAEQGARLRQWDARAVWQLLLAYLLLARGSRFDRRQLVRDTLKALARQFGCGLQVLLAQLVDSLVLSHPDPHRFELLGLLRQLQGELPVQHRYEAGLLAYLRGARAGIPAATAWQSHLALLLMGVDTAARQGLRELLASAALAQVSDRLLSERLMAVVGAAGWPRLVALIEPAALGPCWGILGELGDGQRRGYLPSLAGFDLAWRLPALLLQALPGLRGGAGAGFEPRRFWRRVCDLLGALAQVDGVALHRELLALRRVEPLWGLVASEGWRARLPALPVLGDLPGEAGRQLLVRLAQDPSLDLDAWVERQPERAQALSWLAGQTRQVSVARWSAALLPPGLSPAQGIVRTWMKLFAGCWLGAEALLQQQLTEVFWQVSFDARSLRLDAPRLLARMAVRASQRLDIPLSRLLEAWHAALPGLAHSPWHGAHAWLLQMPQAQPGPAERFVQDHAGRYLAHPRLAEIARHLLWHGKPPGWLEHDGALDLGQLLHDLLYSRRDLLAALLSGVGASPSATQRLMHHMPFAILVDALGAWAPARQSLWRQGLALHQALECLELPGTERGQRTRGLYLWVLEHALARDWPALAADALLSGVLARLVREQALQPATLLPALAARLDPAAKPLHQGLARLAPVVRETPARPLPRRTNTYPPTLPKETTMTPVYNAGLVIMQTYLPMLFSRVKLVQDRKFVSEAAQLRAVQYLHYVCTGQTETPESHAALNKMLCGVAADTPIEGVFEPNEEEIENCKGMIEAVVRNWRAVGQQSVAGMRGNFLIRDGRLEEKQDRWELTVERRPYDVLLNRSPYTFSIIKYQWTPKALSVTWPF